jgi:hypothetical protein
MRFTVGKQEEAVALLFTHHKQRIFSCLLHHNRLLSSLCDGLPYGSDVRRRVNASRPVRVGYSCSGQGGLSLPEAASTPWALPSLAWQSRKNDATCARAEEKLRHSMARPSSGGVACPETPILMGRLSRSAHSCWPRMSDAVTSGKVAIPFYKTTTSGWPNLSVPQLITHEIR